MEPFVHVSSGFGLEDGRGWSLAMLFAVSNTNLR
jgi:hypothetical protein